MTLNQNYRSSQNIVKLASQLLEGVPERQPKKLFSENEEGDKICMTICSNEKSEVEFVAKTIKNLIGKPVKRRDGSDENLTYKDFVILSRKKILGEKFAKGLKAHGIPVIFVGESNVFAIPFVKDFMCFLKVANAPGKSGMEMTRLMTLSRITEQNIAELNRISKKKAYSDPTDIDFVFETLKDYLNLDVSQKHTLKEFLTQIENLIRHYNTSSLSEFVHKVIMSISGIYKQAVISNSPENRRIRLILKELQRIATEFETLNPHGSLSEFISHLTLMGEFDIELDEGYEFEDAVRITTIHKSKGKEYPVVFVVDVAINKLPLRYQAKKFYVPSELSKGVKITEDEKGLYIQEERRLLYVSMTRAQNLLFISYARQYEENKRESKPSRFLEELDFDNNRLISVEHFTSEDTEPETLLFEENRIERLKNDLQIKATQSIFQMNLKTAMDRILDLAKLKYFQENNSLEGFDPIECTKVEYAHDTLDNQLKNIHIPLISKEELMLSASKLDTYSICPLKFKFAHVLEIPSAPKSAMLIGTSVHAVAEHITQLEIDGVNITEEIAFEILDKEWIISAFNSETEANQAMEKAREMLKTYLKWKSANPNKVVAAEQKFTIEIGEIPIKGSIDRIERTLEGDYEVIDFKTGSVKESKASIKDDIQMNVYALATEKLYGVLPKNTFLFYLKKNKIVVNKVESSHVGNIRKSLEDMVNSILREEFEATPSFEACRNCDYQTICDSKKIR
ncbi:MAG: ATP-dependent DNA helicase [Nitrososphaeraceae archaeon]